MNKKKIIGLALALIGLGLIYFLEDGLIGWLAAVMAGIGIGLVFMPAKRNKNKTDGLKYSRQ